MVDFEEAAQEYAYRLTVDPPDLMVDRLDIAAQAYFAGLGISETEKRQTEQIKWMTKPQPIWKLSGWRPGMPGALTTRAAKAVPLLRRGPGGSPKNWAAEKFIEHMKDVAELLDVAPKAPNWDNRKRCYTETPFSLMCDGWLVIVVHAANAEIYPMKFETKLIDKISPQTYRDILEALE